MSGGNGSPGRREALIIASGQYQDPGLGALRSPSRDAEEFAEVLRDQAVGGFGVRGLLDKPGHLLREEIDGFFADRRPEDLLVLYLSCHGVKDVAGQLHFAASTTKLSRLASTGISAGFVYEQVDRCRARKILLLLDCCYSGAFPKGHRPRAGSHAEVKAFEGRGRAVITSCTALEYAFEMDTGQVTGIAAPSVFTAALVEGLRTGDADRDGDGLVSVDELYDYLFDRVRETTPHQTPEKKWGDIRGGFTIAKNPRPPAPPSPPVPPAQNAETPGHARKPAITRRVVFGMAAASAAGLAITGWDLSRHNTPPRQPAGKAPATTPVPTKLWSNSLGASLEAVTGGIVYVSTNAGLSALHATNGRKIWDAKRLSFLARSGDGGIVYASNRNSSALYALRARDGRMIWNKPSLNLMWLAGGLGAAVMAVPEFMGEPGFQDRRAMARGILYAADEYGTVYALRASDGTTLWSYATSQGEPSGLAVAGDIVYTAGANNGAGVYALRGGTELWRSPIDRVIQGPQVARGILYIIANVGKQQWLRALRAGDGKELWTFPTSTTSDAPLISSDALYIEGRHAFYALSPTNGTKLWNFPARARSPLLSGEVVCVATQREAYALRVSDGTKIWSFPAPNGIGATASAGGIVYVASNNLYATTRRRRRNDLELRRGCVLRRANSRRHRLSRRSYRRDICAAFATKASLMMARPSASTAPSRHRAAAAPGRPVPNRSPSCQPPPTPPRARL